MQPSWPIAPPITVASEQKATVWVPSTVPTAASMPLSSSGLISSRLPSSKKAANRVFGLRGSSSRGSFSLAGAVPWAGVMRVLSVVVMARP